MAVLYYGAPKGTVMEKINVKAFVFSYKCFAFPQETFSSLVKCLHSPKKLCSLRGNAKIFRGAQKFFHKRPMIMPPESYWLRVNWNSLIIKDGALIYLQFNIIGMR